MLRTAVEVIDPFHVVHLAAGVMGGVGSGLSVVFLEDAGGVGFGASHVARPFAGAAHVLLGHAAVVDQHAFDRGVETALEPVAVARHRPVRLQFGLEEAEQGSVAEEAFEPEVGAAQPQVRPPPVAPGRGRPGAVGVLAGEGAFSEHVPPAFAPCVGRLAPVCGVVGVVDAGERIGEPLSSLPASRRGRQVRSCLVSRCMWIRHRWMRVPGQLSAQALWMPFMPSHTSTSGSAICANRAL